MLDAHLRNVGVAVAARSRLKRIRDREILRTCLPRHVGRGRGRVIHGDAAGAFCIGAAEVAGVNERCTCRIQYRYEGVGIAPSVGGLKRWELSYSVREEIGGNCRPGHVRISLSIDGNSNCGIRVQTPEIIEVRDTRRTSQGWVQFRDEGITAALIDLGKSGGR